MPELNSCERDVIDFLSDGKQHTMGQIYAAHPWTGLMFQLSRMQKRGLVLYIRRKGCPSYFLLAPLGVDAAKELRQR